MIKLRLTGDDNPKGKLSAQQKDAWNEFAQKNYKPGISADVLLSSFARQRKDIPIEALKNELNAELSDVKRIASSNSQTAPGVENVNNGFMFLKYKMPDGKAYYKSELPQNPLASPVQPPYVPPEVQSLDWDEQAQLPYYKDPGTGDIKYVPKEYLHLPRFKPKNVKLRVSGNNPIG